MNNIVRRVRINIFSWNFSFSFVPTCESYTYSIYIWIGILGCYTKMYFLLWVEVRDIEWSPTSYCVQEVAGYISDGWPPNFCFKTAADAELSHFVQLPLLSTTPNCHQRVFFIMHCHWLPCKETLGLLVQYGKHRRHLHHLHLTVYLLSNDTGICSLYPLYPKPINTSPLNSASSGDGSRALLPSDQPRKPLFPRIWTLGLFNSR